MVERLGIFGGTFDPPHIAHQILAAEALDQLELKKVLWVLTPDPPHKRGRNIAPLEIRFAMVKAAVEDCPGFEISRVEIDRPAPHYAVDTLLLLMQQNPRSEMIYLMGGDSLRDLPNWYASQKFVVASHAIGVMRRSENEIDLKQLEMKTPGITAKVQFITAPLLEIAASQIRFRIQTGRSYRYFLPPSVYQIIQSEKLYQVQRPVY